MSQLSELKAQLLALVDRRRVLIEQAERTIATANREFDKEAIQLGRMIAELEEQEWTHQERTHKTTTKPARKRREAAKPMLNLDGLTNEEIEYFNQLLSRKG